MAAALKPTSKPEARFRTPGTASVVCARLTAYLLPRDFFYEHLKFVFRQMRAHSSKAVLDAFPNGLESLAVAFEKIAGV